MFMTTNNPQELESELRCFWINGTLVKHLKGKKIHQFDLDYSTAKPCSTDTAGTRKGLSIKSGAYFCYYAYVLRISRWPEKVGFLNSDAS